MVLRAAWRQSRRSISQKSRVHSEIMSDGGVALTLAEIKNNDV